MVKVVERIDFFDSTYSHFTDKVLDVVRKETFGVDIGQNSWLTVDDAERFDGLQRFFASVQQLTSERRLSRIVYLAEKRAG